MPEDTDLDHSIQITDTSSVFAFRDEESGRFVKCDFSTGVVETNAEEVEAVRIVFDALKGLIEYYGLDRKRLIVENSDD